MKINKQIRELYGNLYSRKNELSNLLIIIEEQKSNFEKQNLLLISGIISLNSHWEGYLRDLFGKYIEYINLHNYIFILKDNFYKKTLGKGEDINVNNNIKYDHLKEIIIKVFGNDFLSQLLEEYKTRVNKKYFIDRDNNKFFYEINQIKIKFLINSLVDSRNFFAHGKRGIGKLDKNRLKLYYLLIFEFLELLTEKIINILYSNSFIKDSYIEHGIENYLKQILEKNLESKDGKSFIDFLKRNSILTKDKDYILDNYFFDDTINQVSVNYKRTKKTRKFNFKLENSLIIKESINQIGIINFLDAKNKKVKILK